MFELTSLIYYLVIAGVTYWAYNVYHSLFLSPLKDIPGPLILQIFPFYKGIARFQGLEHSEEVYYHEVYGPTVRLGWNRVIFASPEAASEIYSTHAYKKGPFYKVMRSAGVTVFSTDDREFHQKRKRIIAPAFSQKYIDSLDESIRRAGIEPMIEVLDRHASEGSMADLYLLFGSSTIDVIGEVSFGKTFNTIRAGGHPFVKWFSQSQVYNAFYLIFPFLLGLKSPPLRKMQAFGIQAVENFLKGPQKDSIMKMLIESTDPETGDKLSIEEVVSEATLQMTFYLVMKHQQIYKRLVEELEEAFPNKDSSITIPDIKAAKLPFMEAVIKESMRLMPAAQRAFERLVPEGGRKIHGYFIPEGTIVGANILALHTLKALWGEDAKEFKPERWLSGQLEPEGEVDALSHRSPCLSWSTVIQYLMSLLTSSLAMAETRLVVANLFRKYEFAFISPDQTLTPFTIAFTRPKEECFHVYVSTRET
ncbi:hypothetical protein DSO57_1033694 [Entomophthora muscae]|uniref:Uncharacterized protein n=1 Tax=Entomophthora muscae TaxID=34485 RepID=A0ACC2UKV2_9FUNG|nr:hypothetical protein DSO57_1033694 [Entomophthora muscae]